MGGGGLKSKTLSSPGLGPRKPSLSGLMLQGNQNKGQGFRVRFFLGGEEGFRGGGRVYRGLGFRGLGVLEV